MRKPEPTRREFLKSAGAAGAAAAVVSRASRAPAEAQARSTAPTLRSVDTPVLTIGYEESGDPSGVPIVLLHGFPYDIRAWDGVAPPLAEAGYRVLAPYLRGYGTTRFRNPGAPRMAGTGGDRAGRRRPHRRPRAGARHPGRLRLGQPRRLHHVDPPSGSGARAGGDWWLFGAEHRVTVRPIAVGRSRGAALVPVVLQHRTRPSRSGGEPAGPSAATSGRRGRPRGSTRTRCGKRSAPSFDNPDFVDVVIHSYRHRHGYAPGEERFLDVGRRLAERPPITVPAIVLRGAESGFGRPSDDPSGDQRRFTNLIARRIVEGAGHDLAPQRPDAVVDALLELLA